MMDGDALEGLVFCVIFRTTERDFEKYMERILNEGKQNAQWIAKPMTIKGRGRVHLGKGLTTMPKTEGSVPL